MARDQRQPRIRQLAVDDVKVGPAHRARLDAHNDLARPGPRISSRLHRQRMARRGKDHGLH
jgi:hypothetical protein